MTQKEKIEKCFCQSYYDINGILKGCTCGECNYEEKEKEKLARKIVIINLIVIIVLCGVIHIGMIHA